MADTWDKSDDAEIWFFRKGQNIVIIHLNKFTGTYDASAVKEAWGNHIGLAANGFDTLEDAQEWSRRLVEGK